MTSAGLPARGAGGGNGSISLAEVRRPKNEPEAGHQGKPLAAAPREGIAA